MSAKIYWFSGTGNSLTVAKRVAEALPDAELVPVAEAIHNPPAAAEVIGIVCPVYAFGVPVLVARFIEQLNASSDSYIFTVMTCGGAQGGAPVRMRKLFQQRGLDLHAAWSVTMPDNYPPLGSAPPPEKQREMNAAADEKIAQIVEELPTFPRDRYEVVGGIWKLVGMLGYPAFCYFIKRGADRKFRADDRCNGCGLCAEVCPVDDIEMIDDRPDWKGRCEQCFACFHWCPQQAVQFGRSAKLRRYHHPTTIAADFLPTNPMNQQK